MCFGDQKTGEKTQTYQANPAVSNAATSNIQYVQGLQNAGFTPYTGQQVAGFSPQQQSSFGMTDTIANNGTAPQATSLINSYAGAPAQSVSADAISNHISPYMSQYIMQALAPQLTAMDIQNAKTNANTNAQATGSGAFGDARTGIEQAQNSFLQNVQREGVIGNAYDQAFKTALGAGAQDVSNSLAAQNANANYMETALGRALGGANALQNLQNQQLGVAQAQNVMGQQQTAQDQAGLTAAYNQWLMAQQYPFQVAQLMNSTTQAGSGALKGTTTETETKPDNSGLSLLGSLGGSLLGNSGFGTALGAFMFSDEDLKEDIEKVGELSDGTPIFSYRYFDDAENVRRIGVMAQDVEKRNPDAVKELWPGGAKVVDYGKATALARALAMAA